MSNKEGFAITVEITKREWDDYLRLQEVAKTQGWTLFDMLRTVGTMQTVLTEGHDVGETKP